MFLTGTKPENFYITIEGNDNLADLFNQELEDEIKEAGLTIGSGCLRVSKERYAELYSPNIGHLKIKTNGKS